MKTDLEDFTEAYETAALWSSSYDERGDKCLDDGEHDLAPETREAMAADCKAFYLANESLLTDDSYEGRASGGVIQQAGHDFWLTRCGHGAGFWDGDWKEPAADILDNAAKAFGNVDMYVGDDGMIYSD